ncbi:MAG: hypothetical protein ALECFALPRED_010346 [Alectoria fallacina]|uniref:tripeptidyl-peptidase II n=1 Tax=Alectoria fallacina TaxID=1903189 RepID=A0A8H3J9B2_9LECA|nr:MAG: hypothetical protein ALECFALPRED_010346 [Alectoria fallacina]
MLMYILSVPLAFLAASTTILSSPLRSRTEYAVKDTHHVPRKWHKVGPAPAHALLNLHIGLKQSQFDELERHLYEVSTPSHPRYGQHLTNEEVDELVKPADDTLNLVHDWLFDSGIDRAQLSYNRAKDFIKVSLPVGEIERLLDTKYSIYKHLDGDRILRAPEWSLPKHLHDHIDVIQPTNSFFRPAGRRTTLKTIKPFEEVEAAPAPDFTAETEIAATPDSENAAVAKVCNTTFVTPLCLRTFYGTKGYKPQVPGQNQVGLADFLGEVNNRSDVQIFLEMFRKAAAPEAETFSVDVINGGNNQQTPDNATQLAAGKDLEGNLDAETIIGIDYPTPLTAFTTGGMPPFDPDDLTPTDTNEPYLQFLNAVLDMDTLPQIISSSYGDDEQTVPEAYAKKVCNLFAQLGAKGTSFLCASGDNGVGPTGDCFTNDGKNTSTFLPSFPDGCPYVTSVGATKNFNPEVVAFDTANGFSSGGGFSNYFARPTYQNDNSVVKNYISSLGGEFDGLYNQAGRGYPDIAAQGQRFVTIWNGTIVILDGTSASTPTASAILALVNDALLAAGKPALGFLNPWLYSTGYSSFSDITSGSAIGCGGSGFPALAGWDAVSGLGTPVSIA